MPLTGIGCTLYIKHGKGFILNDENNPRLHDEDRQFLVGFGWPCSCNLWALILFALGSEAMGVWDVGFRLGCEVIWLSAPPLPPPPLIVFPGWGNTCTCISDPPPSHSRLMGVYSHSKINNNLKNTVNITSNNLAIPFNSVFQNNCSIWWRFQIFGWAIFCILVWYRESYNSELNLEPDWIRGWVVGSEAELEVPRLSCRIRGWVGGSEAELEDPSWVVGSDTELDPPMLCWIQSCVILYAKCKLLSAIILYYWLFLNATFCSTILQTIDFASFYPLAK